jgi:two-component system, OmpR family, response regulator
MRILVIEDERAIADFVQRGLEAEGYAVTCAHDGEEGERLALSGDFHLIVLDVMLPGRDGLEVLGEVRRRRPEVPVVMLTARGEIEDKIAGLDQGATDYLTKPFSFDELAARIRAHLRKPDQAQSTGLKVGDLGLDLLTREVRRGDDEIRLSSTEFDLLAYFMRHPGQVLSREQILSAVWSYDHDPGTNVVGVYISYLRRKLDRDGEPSPIETMRGAGYRLRARPPE